jgi:hypothetical protein
MMVMDHSAEFRPHVCGLFCVDFSDPEADGTGYTIHICCQYDKARSFRSGLAGI